MSSPQPPEFRESAVVVLVRGHGDGLETYWVRRSDDLAVMPGHLRIPQNNVVSRVPAHCKRPVRLEPVALLRPVQADEKQLGHSNDCS